MEADDQKYQNHAAFGELDRLIAFYDGLSHFMFLWVSPGTNAWCNIDSYVYSSIRGTLASIRSILRDGQINDAYALLRKYYDSAIIQEVFDLLMAKYRPDVAEAIKNQTSMHLA